MSLLDWFRPRWKHSNADVRRDAIREIEDPAILVDMIVEDGEWFIRHEALGALRAMKPEQTHFHQLMRRSTDEEVRRKVVKVMTDETELDRVAREDQYRYIREAAEHRLNELRTSLWDHLEQ